MKIKDTAILAVDCYAAIVPEGTPIVLNKGMQVEITQNLGGQVTAIASGHLVRISGEDAKAALGPAYQDPMVIELPEDASIEVGHGHMKTCYDPRFL